MTRPSTSFAAPTEGLLGRRRAAHRRLVAGGQLPVGRPDLPDGQPAAARAAAARARQAAAARALGHDARAELRLRPPQPGDHGARPRHDVRDRARARRPGAGGVGVARGHLQRGLPRHHPGRGGDGAGCSRSSPSPAASPATWRRRRPGRSTRAASSATRCPTPTAPRSTTPTWSWPRSSVTARPRPGRWRPAGTRNKFVDPAPRRRGAADPAPQRLQDRQPDRAGPDPRGGARPAAARLRPHAVRRRRRRPGRRCTRRSRPPSTAASTRSATSSAEARAAGEHRAAPRWPMIVLRTPEGLDRARRRSTALRVEGSWRSHQVPFADARGNDGHRAVLEELDAQLPARGALRRRRRARSRRSATCTPPATGG